VLQQQCFVPFSSSIFCLFSVMASLAFPVYKNLAASVRVQPNQQQISDELFPGYKQPWQNRIKIK
jgi:hypothetical protein